MTVKRRREGFYTIGVVSKMFDIHPQTLRLYEKRGLLTPTRTGGNTRLYSQRDIDTLEFILTLTNELHVNVAGVEIIVHLRQKIQELQQRLAALGEEAAAAATASALGSSCTTLVRVAPRVPLRREPPAPEAPALPRRRGRAAS